MISQIKKALQILSESEKGKTLGLIFLVMILAFLEVAGIGSIVPFLAIAEKRDVIHSNVQLSWIFDNFGFKDDVTFIVAFGVGVLLLLVGGNLMKIVISYATMKYSMNCRTDVSNRVFSIILHKNYEYFMSENTANLIKNIIDEVNRAIIGVILPLLDLVSKSLVTITILILLVIVNPFLAFGSAILFGGIYFSLYLFSRKRIHSYGQNRVKYSYERYRSVSDAVTGIKDVKILGVEKYFLDSFRDSTNLLAQGEIKNSILQDFPKFFVEMVAYGAVVVTLLITILLQKDLVAIFPILGVYMLSLYKLMPYIQTIFKNVSSIKYELSSVDVLFNNYFQKDFVEREQENTLKLIFNSEIKIETMRYSYPIKRNYEVFIPSLKIRKNTSVAFVGSTGAGKTTVADLLMGLLTPTSGALFLDDQAINKANLKSWQNQIGYVPQSIFIINDSIRKNIAFGIDNKNIDNSRVDRALDMSNLSDFVKTLPQGWDTNVGDRGVQLSGGQRQRIGIARALYRDPEVLILDEATSALDSVTEKAIMEAIERLNHTKTIVIIAHRLTTIKNVDLIVFLANGQVIDQGNFDELYIKNENFRKMAQGLKN